ncbi:MAG: hypothetical protein ACPGJV_04135 [Bacteriovoracaceae bacterium]
MKTNSFLASLFGLLLIGSSCLPLPIEEMEKSELTEFDKGHGRDEKKANNLNSQIRVMDQRALGDFFKQGFGESNPKTKEMVELKVYAKKDLFGGPCNYYESAKTLTNQGSSFKVGKVYIESYEDYCSGKQALLINSTVPSVNISREAYRSYVCEQLVKDEDAFTHFFDKFDQISETDLKIISIYQYFYIAHLPDSPTIRKMKALVQPSLDDNQDLSGWKDLVLLLCSLPDWQNV